MAFSKLKLAIITRYHGYLLFLWDVTKCQRELTVIAVGFRSFPAGQTNLVTVFVASVVAEVVISRTAPLPAPFAVVMLLAHHSVLVLQRGVVALMLIVGPLFVHV